VKKFLPLLICLGFVGWFVTTLAPKPDGKFALGQVARFPVLMGGRHQPLDSVARNALVQIRERYSVYDLAEKREIPAIEWICETFFNPAKADSRKIFRIDHPELISLLTLPSKTDEPDAFMKRLLKPFQTLLGSPSKNDETDPAKKEDGKHYSWNQIVTETNGVALDREFKRISELESKAGSTELNPFDQAIKRLGNALLLYRTLQGAARVGEPGEFAAMISEYHSLLDTNATAIETIRARYPSGEIPDGKKDPLLTLASRIIGAERALERDKHTEKVPLLIPPEDGQDWSRIGARLVNLRGSTPISPALLLWAKMGDAFAKGDAIGFNQAVREYATLCEIQQPADVAKARREVFFNQMAPFYTAMIIYIVALLFAMAYWFHFEPWVRETSFYLVGFAFVIHTVGLVFRMVLEGRPPVTNLYSSAIFIGWGSIALGMVLERFWRNAIGLCVGSMLGFVTLIIAHNLALEGDTMEMLRAVLDTNFWLATHVVIVTLGYASTFVAGFLALVYVVRGVFTASLDQATGRALARMVYGIVCFATLFSFTGTVLGGIWADQSWGRFWGWDPKENGALIIVLWNALILHARWGGLVRDRGVMNLAIAGNIVTAWSWFGVNMLGVGLHSYGFMNGAFQVLAAFVVSQLVLIGLGSMPLKYWRSFNGMTQGPEVKKAKSTPGPKAVPAAA
jgi:ABC-type transport system involved in cytochrome c biogenesis permease subunit